MKSAPSCIYAGILSSCIVKLKSSRKAWAWSNGIFPSWSRVPLSKLHFSVKSRLHVVVSTLSSPHSLHSTLDSIQDNTVQRMLRSWLGLEIMNLLERTRTENDALVAYSYSIIYNLQSAIYRSGSNGCRVLLGILRCQQSRLCSIDCIWLLVNTDSTRLAIYSLQSTVQEQERWGSFFGSNGRLETSFGIVLAFGFDWIESDSIGLDWIRLLYNCRYN
jgi:hypothetical protein